MLSANSLCCTLLGGPRFGYTALYSGCRLERCLTRMLRDFCENKSVAWAWELACSRGCGCQAGLLLISHRTRRVKSPSLPELFTCPPAWLLAQSWATSGCPACSLEALGCHSVGALEALWVPGLTPGALSCSFRHCVLRLAGNNSQPLMTKLQWLFAFLEHSQVSAGMLERRPGLMPPLPQNPPAPASGPRLAVCCWAPV